MTAQIQFFCNSHEEAAVLARLTADKTVIVFLLDGHRMIELPAFSIEQLPQWPEFFCLYFWAKEYGPLQWHASRPKVEDTSARSFVMRFFARKDWDKLSLEKGDGLLDQDLSPGICYKRPESMDGKIGPCTLIAPPSNIERVSADYTKWVNRCLGWIRRRGKIVHDWRSRSMVIPNPRSILNTVYAFPEALKEIESENHNFTIL